jgi:hypothetical protein
MDKINLSIKLLINIHNLMQRPRIQLGLHKEVDLNPNLLIINIQMLVETGY